MPEEENPFSLAFTSAGLHLMAVIPTVFSYQGLAYGSGFAAISYIDFMIKPKLKEALPEGTGGSAIYAIYNGIKQVIEFRYGMGLGPLPKSEEEKKKASFMYY